MSVISYFLYEKVVARDLMIICPVYEKYMSKLKDPESDKAMLTQQISDEILEGMWTPTAKNLFRAAQGTGNRYDMYLATAKYYGIKWECTVLKEYLMSGKNE